MTITEGFAVLIAFMALMAAVLAVSFANEAKKKIHPALQATVNRAYSKAQQALENSVEAIQIATDTVPEKPNKPCNSKFWAPSPPFDGVIYNDREYTCTLPKYPGHEKHRVIT